MRLRFLLFLTVVGLLVTGQSPVGGQEAPVEPTPFDEDRAAEAGRQAGDDPSGGFPPPVTAADETTATYRVFATQYRPHVEGSVEVAVPDKCAKFAALGNASALSQFGCPSGYSLGLDYRVSVTLANGRGAVFPVKEVGPWNIDDNYWGGAPGSPRPRRLFRDLPRGRPEAHAAFYDGYNTRTNCLDLDRTPYDPPRTGGADQFGRCVLNPAGIDLSVAAAAQLGLAPLENAWVDVTFMWEGGTTPGSPVSVGGTAKPALARGSTRFLRHTLTTGAADIAYVYGNPTDIAVMGDWDGDGTRTPGVFRGGVWHLRNRNSTGSADGSFGFGDPGDLPVVGDWDGDGFDTIGVFRGGVWHLRNSNSTGPADGVFGFGDPGDVPVTGDWNNDPFDTLGVFRGGRWFLRNSNSTGAADVSSHFGDPADRPVVGDWDNDGADTPGVFRAGWWFLRNDTGNGVAHREFLFGDRGDRPLVWS